MRVDLCGASFADFSCRLKPISARSFRFVAVIAAAVSTMNASSALGQKKIEIPTVHLMNDPLIAGGKIGIDDLPAIMEELNFLVALEDVKTVIVAGLNDVIASEPVDSPERKRLEATRDQIAAEIDHQTEEFQKAHFAETDKQRTFYEGVARKINKSIDENLRGFFRDRLSESIPVPRFEELQGRTYNKQIEAFNLRYPAIKQAALLLIKKRSAVYQELLELGGKAAKLIQEYNRYCGDPNIKKPPGHLEKCQAEKKAIDDLRYKMNDKAKEVTDEIEKHNRESRLLKSDVDRFFEKSVRPVVDRYYRNMKVAETAAIAGNVREIPEQGDPRPLDPTEKLRGARTYATDTAGAVKLTLSDRSAVTVGPESRITFESGMIGARSYQIEPTLRLASGTLRSSAASELSHQAVFSTPLIVLKVTGTDFILRADQDGRTTIELLEGAVEFTPLDSAVPKTLSAGQGAVIEPDGKITIIQELDRADVESRWKALPGIKDLPTGAAPSN